jgi:hypothetical protein
MRTLTIAVLCLVFPAAALAKGPSEATIEGPWLRAPLKIDGSGGWGKGTPFQTLVEETAFFPAMWGGNHTVPMLRARPAGALGPRYRVTYRVPGPTAVDRIRQDLYPHARGGPVTFTPPGQRFFDGQKTLGGWYRGEPRLRTTLLAAGLPSPRPPSQPARADSSSDRTIVVIGLGGVIALVVAAAALLLVRGDARRAAAA